MATIQGVYIALFGRPADPAGLAFFNEATGDGADLTAIGDLAATAEYQGRFEGMSNVQIITAIYQSLFNRAPEAAGLEFFAAALEDGTLTINNIAIAILDGAAGTDADIIENKLTAANAFTAALDTATERQAYSGDAAAQAGVNFLADITADASTVPSAAATDAAIAAIVAAAPGVDPVPGVEIFVTAGDTVSPNHANPAFKSTNADDVITAGNLDDDNNLNAGLGNDTLVIKAAGAIATTDPTLAGIENIVIADENFAVDLGLKNASGVSSIDVQETSAAITLRDVALGTEIALAGNTAPVDVSFAKADKGTADAASLTVGGTVSALTIDDIETINLKVDGNSAFTALNADALETLVITGKGSLTVATSAATNVVETVDASGLNGALTLNLVNNTVDTTVTGTKLADSITLEATSATEDVVVYNSTNISTLSLRDTIANFDFGADGDALDLSAFGLTGAKAVTDFTVAPVDGAGFAGNALAVNGGFLYVDSNNDGAFNQATDLVIAITGVTAANFDAAENVIWA